MGLSSKLALSLLFSSALVAVPSLVQAQAAPSAPTPSAAPDEGAGGAIVVTALRQSTNIQKTPVQVTALSGQKLKDAAVNQLADVTYLAPSVRFTSNSGTGQTAIAMRGIGSSPSAYAVKGVQVYEEEVPLAGPALNLAPFDVSDVQVLEGPQGTLFGRNTLAGAILVEPKLPSFNQDAYIKAGYGSFNYWTLEGAGNATLIPDVLAVRLAGQIQRRDGDIRSLSPTIGPQGTLATEAFRASVLFTPTPTFKDVLTVDYFNEHDTGNPVMVVNPGFDVTKPYPYPFYVLSLPPFFQPVDPAVAAQLAACHHTCLDYGTTPQSDIFFKNEHVAVFNTTTWNVTPNLELKNIFGYQDTKDGISEMTLPALVPLFVAEDIEPQTRLTEEVQVIGHAIDNRLEARAGFYYENDWSHGPNGHNTVNFFSFQSAGQKQESEALYGDINFKVTPRLSFRGGFRYTWDKQSACLGNSPSSTSSGTSEQCNASAAMPGGGPLLAGIKTQSDAAPTWTYGVDYQATDNIFFYFTGSRGYRAPALNPLFTNPCLLGGSTTSGPMCGNDLGLALGGPATGKSIDLSSIAFLQPETIDNFEGGVKTQWHIGDARVTFNIDVFHFDYNNAEDQINLGAPTTVLNDLLAGCPTCTLQTTFGSVTYNGGKVSATGFEGEFTVMPFKDFTFDAHFSYLDEKLVSLAIPVIFSGAGLNPAQLAVATSIGPASSIQQITSPTSPWSFTLAAHYVLPWHPLRGDLVFNYDYFWTSSWFAQNLPVPGYDLHNIRVDWDHVGGSNIDLGFWVRNLFNKDYELGAVDQPLGAASWGEPRMIGFDVTAKFH